MERSWAGSSCRGQSEISGGEAQRAARLSCAAVMLLPCPSARIICGPYTRCRVSAVTAASFKRLHRRRQPGERTTFRSYLRVRSGRRSFLPSGASAPAFTSSLAPVPAQDGPRHPSNAAQDHARPGTLNVASLRLLALGSSE